MYQPNFEACDACARQNYRTPKRIHVGCFDTKSAEQIASLDQHRLGESVHSRALLASDVLYYHLSWNSFLDYVLKRFLEHVNFRKDIRNET